MVFMLKAIGDEFNASVEQVSEALFLTLAARPAGALVFGWLGDRFGRRPVLMVVIALFSALSGASGPRRIAAQLLLIRALLRLCHGRRMGPRREPGDGDDPGAAARAGVRAAAVGLSDRYLLASLAYYLLFDAIGWRAMFFIGIAAGAVRAVYPQPRVEESPTFAAPAAQAAPGVLRGAGRSTGSWRCT